MRGINRWPVNYPHKGPVTRKIFPFYDVTMIYMPVHWPANPFRDTTQHTMASNTNPAECWLMLKFHVPAICRVFKHSLWEIMCCFLSEIIFAIHIKIFPFNIKIITKMLIEQMVFCTWISKLFKLAFATNSCAWVKNMELKWADCIPQRLGNLQVK